MLLFYIIFGDRNRNPPYPTGSNIPSARRLGQRFHFLQCRGVFAESSLRKQAWRNPKEGRVGFLSPKHIHEESDRYRIYLGLLQ